MNGRVFSSPVAGFSMTHIKASKCAMISRALSTSSASPSRSRRGRVVSARLYSVQTGSSKEQRLIVPYSFSDFGQKTLQNSQILQPAERFSDVTGLCHHSVFGAKSAENGELRKVRFFVSCVKSSAWASKFARFPSKTGSRCSPCSEIRILPRKTCEFQPAELVTACHRFVTARFLGATVRKIGPSSRAPSPQGFSRPDSPPRCSRVTRQPAEVFPRNESAR